MQPDILKTEEVASRLRLSKRYIEALRLKGAGPRHIRIGRAVRYRIEDVNDWVRSRVRSSTSDAGGAA